MAGVHCVGEECGVLELSGSSTSFVGGACGVLELFGVAASFAAPLLPWLV